MKRLNIRTPDDFHRHMRQGLLLALMAKHIYPFGRILPMPNTTPPKSTGEMAMAYASEIRAAAPGIAIVPCIKLLDSTTPEIILAAAALGVQAVKFYPEGMTTNSEDGISADSLYKRGELLTAIQESGLLLLLHGEHDKTEFCLNRETAFLKVAGWILRNFPKLRVVLEHITTSQAVEFVTAYSSRGALIAATITPHHLRITLNDVIGDKLSPHNFCKPIAKRPADRRCLIAAATSGNPCFFLGTDDAPHLRTNKECASGCAGVFCGPYAVSHYAEVFDQAGKLEKLENFSSKFGAEFYGLPLNKDSVELVYDPVIIPQNVDGVTPFQAGELLHWRVA